MQDYTRRQTYIPVELSEEDLEEHAPHAYGRIKVDPRHPIYGQTDETFDEAGYRFPTLPLFVGKFSLSREDVEKLDMNVLRLMVRDDDPDGKVVLPKALAPLAPLVLQNVNYHRQFFAGNAACFLYLTVRVCDADTLFYRNSCEWHVDGYQGARVARHRMEQNAFWSNANPTEFSVQPFFLEGINPRLHDINEAFDRLQDPACAVRGVEDGVYFVNPYHVHRTSPERFEGKRVFVRLNFSPVAIEDPTNTVNPAFPQSRCAPREDVRNFLHAYPVDEAACSGVAPLFGIRHSPPVAPA
jgi:hypothetical protein